MPSAQLARAALVLSLAACAAPWMVTAACAQPGNQPKPKAKPAPRPAAQAAPRPAASPDTQGFLYGRLTSRGGTVYEGRLRWGKEEAFWGDLFHSNKAKNPYFDQLPEKDRREARRIEVFGVPIGVHWEEHQTRQFAVRFGDIRKIEPRRGGDVVVLLKSGSRHELNGGSNDVGNPVTVWDRSLGQVEVDWDDIASIEFLPAPQRLAVGAHRLYGTVKTRDGEFRGFLQWDQDEGLSTDELDGEARDGNLSLPMGNVRTIERHQLNRADVTLRDGRTLTMSGTNDVNGDNRGVYVDDPRFGRVLISWEAFQRVDFSPPPGSGPAYTDYQPGRPLRGKVTARDGKVYSGRLVYDADEAETIEFLDGDRNEISYAIPFARVAFLLPEPEGTTRVILKDGNELKLEETVDVSDDNAGVLVYANGQEKPRHIAWKDVRRIDFE
jgi:hypothetical protein